MVIFSVVSGGWRGVIGAGLMGLMLAGSVSAQQAYPARPIRWVVPYAAGGAADITSRIIASQMSKQIGQNVLVDLMPGASGVIGSEHVRRAEPDGHTIVLGSSASHAASTITMKSLPYDPVQDFKHIVLINKLPNVMFVASSSKIRNMADMLAALRAQPGTAFGTSGPGSASFLSGELFKVMAKVEMTPVHYKGAGPMVQDVIAGNVPLGFADVGSVVPHIRNGNLRALAITDSERLAAVADVPTIAEGGVTGYESVSWQAVMAPAATPDPIVRRLNAEFVKAINSAEVKPKLEGAGSIIATGSPEALRDFVRADVRKWKNLAEVAKLKFE